MSTVSLHIWKGKQNDGFNIMANDRAIAKNSFSDWIEYSITATFGDHMETNQLQVQSNRFNTDTKEMKQCPYYRGRVCMEFDLFRTIWTVRNREVSVL